VQCAVRRSLYAARRSYTQFKFAIFLWKAFKRNEREGAQRKLKEYHFQNTLFAARFSLLAVRYAQFIHRIDDRYLFYGKYVNAMSAKVRKEYTKNIPFKIRCSPLAARYAQIIHTIKITTPD
jgi:hypothetical protein